MKRRKQVTINRGLLIGKGKTKTEALADINKQVDWAISDSTLHVENRYGFTIIIGRQPNGWQSMLLDPTEMIHGKVKHCSGSCGPIDFKVVLRGARMNAAQSAWQHDLDDATHIAASGLDECGQKELASYFMWQRRYKQARDSGKTDSEAFDIASGRDTAFTLQNA